VNNIFQEVEFQVRFHACVQLVIHRESTTDAEVTKVSVTLFVVQLDRVIGHTFFIVDHNQVPKASCVQELLDIQVATSSHVKLSVSEAIKFTIAVLNVFDQATSVASASIEAVWDKHQATSSQLMSHIKELIRVVKAQIVSGLHVIQSATFWQVQAQDRSQTTSSIACCTLTLLSIAVTMSHVISVQTQP